MNSPSPKFITIGRILTPWGNQGKLKVQIETKFPQRFNPSSEVYINQQPMTIESAERQKDKIIIKLRAINTKKAAEKLRSQLVEIHHSQLRSLPDRQYYHFELVGLEVRTTQGDLLGRITDVLTSSSNDNYVVSRAGEEILIPATEEIIKSIDLKKGRLIIEPIEGLLNLNKKAAR